VLGMPVKIGIPSGFAGGLVREIENPVYSTAVGLVYHGLKYHERTTNAAMNSTAEKSASRVKLPIGAIGRSNILEKMKSWFDEL